SVQKGRPLFQLPRLPTDLVREWELAVLATHGPAGKGGGGVGGAAPCRAAGSGAGPNSPPALVPSLTARTWGRRARPGYCLACGWGGDEEGDFRYEADRINLISCTRS